MKPDDFFEQFLEDPEPSFQMALKNKLKDFDTTETAPELNFSFARLSLPRPQTFRWRFATIAVILIISATFLFSSQSLAQVLARIVASIKYEEPESAWLEGETLGVREREFVTLPDDVNEAKIQAQVSLSFQEPTYLPEGFVLEEVTLSKFKTQISEVDGVRSSQVGDGKQVVELMWLDGSEGRISLFIQEKEDYPYVVDEVDSISVMMIENKEISVIRGSWTTVDGDIVFVKNGSVDYAWVIDGLEYRLISDESFLNENEATKMISSIILNK